MFRRQAALNLLWAAAVVTAKHNASGHCPSFHDNCRTSISQKPPLSTYSHINDRWRGDSVRYLLWQSTLAWCRDDSYVYLELHSGRHFLEERLNVQHSPKNESSRLFSLCPKMLLRLDVDSGKLTSSRKPLNGPSGLSTKESLLFRDLVSVCDHVSIFDSETLYWYFLLHEVCNRWSWKTLTLVSLTSSATLSLSLRSFHNEDNRSSYKSKPHCNVILSLRIERSRPFKSTIKVRSIQSHKWNNHSTCNT